ncbi:MAG: hypothetical protein U0P45_13450 [Acidimicrobiales bacterium]
MGPRRARLGRMVDGRAGWLVPVVAWAGALWAISALQQLAWSRAHGAPWHATDLLWPHPFGTTGRIRFDADRFVALARRGYRPADHDQAVFPLYPLAIRWLAAATGADEAVAAVRISLASGLAVALLWWRWMQVKGIDGLTRMAGLLVLLAYPWAFVLYGVAYSDGLALALVLAAVLLVEARHPVLAALVAVLVAAARPPGVLLVPALVLLALEVDGAFVLRPATGGPAGTAGTAGAASADGPSGRTGALGRWWRGATAPLRQGHVVRERLRWPQAAPLAGLIGLAAFAGWNWRRVGSPLAFASAQRYFGHRALTDPLLWVKADLVRNGNVFVTRLDPLHQALSLAVVVLVVATVPAVGRRFGWGYALLAALSAVVAWASTVLFAAAGRYLLPVVPFALAAVLPWLCRRPWRLVVVLVAFVAWQVALVWGFSGPLVPIINQAAW